MSKIVKYLSTDKRQFGFKKSTGCSNAIYALKETVDFIKKQPFILAPVSQSCHKPKDS